MTQWGLDTLFNPAKRHMDEEKRRLQSTREEVGDSSGGKRIDLESGKVVIRKEEAADKDEAADVDEAPDQRSAKPATKPAAKAATKAVSKAATKAAPSPAAVRAAQRRGRQPR
jgi:hypothetical protein